MHEMFHAEPTLLRVLANQSLHNISLSKLYKCSDFDMVTSLCLEINPLKTKRRPLYLKDQFVPRSKHFSSRL